MKTFTVILEYCGGAHTDDLFAHLRSWNPDHKINVLDNASPNDRCRCITHQNLDNTFVGGGIINCIDLAEANDCDNLLLILNDIEPITPILIDEFESALESDSKLVQVAASVTPDSTFQAFIYPWMITQSSVKPRTVPHSDILCCITRISFIRSFGGFRPSRGGYGYDWELAYQAVQRGLHVAILDSCTVRHEDRLTIKTRRERYLEMLEVYATRYPRNEFNIERIIAEYKKRYV